MPTIDVRGPNWETRPSCRTSSLSAICMIDGRWAIIYSKYDVGCSLEGHKSTDCLGHSKESALQLAGAAVLYSLKR